jgi:hypothetical protein
VIIIPHAIFLTSLVLRTDTNLSMTCASQMPVARVPLPDVFCALYGLYGHPLTHGSIRSDTNGVSFDTEGEKIFLNHAT